MATPQQLVTDAAAYSSIPNQSAVIIALLAQIAGMSDPQTIITEAACYTCIPQGLVGPIMIYLLNAIAAGGGGGGGGGITCSAIDPVGAPSGSCGMHFNTATESLWAWNGSAWKALIA